MRALGTFLRPATEGRRPSEEGRFCNVSVTKLRPLTSKSTLLFLHCTKNNQTLKYSGIEMILLVSGVSSDMTMRFYPGTIVEVSETHVHVKCMHRVGHNRYYWPMREDALWFPFEDVLRLIRAPQHLTARHVEIKKRCVGRYCQIISSWLSTHTHTHTHTNTCARANKHVAQAHTHIDTRHQMCIFQVPESKNPAMFLDLPLGVFTNELIYLVEELV